MLFHFLGQQVFCEYCIENIKEHLTKYQEKWAGSSQYFLKNSSFLSLFTPTGRHLGQANWGPPCIWVRVSVGGFPLWSPVWGTLWSSSQAPALIASPPGPQHHPAGSPELDRREKVIVITVSLWCFGPCCQYFTYTKTKQQNVVFVCLCSCYLQQSGGDWSEHMYPRLQAPPHLPHWWEQAGPAVHRAALRKKCKMNASTVWSDKISVESTYNKAVCFI